MKALLVVAGSPLYVAALLGVGNLGFAAGLGTPSRIAVRLPETASYQADPLIPSLRRLDAAAISADAARDTGQATAAGAAAPVSSSAPAPSPATTGHGNSAKANGKSTSQPTPASTKSTGGGRPLTAPGNGGH